MLDHTKAADVKIDLISGMKLIAHDPLAGFGGVGEGMSLQKAPDGRRILWLAHEGPPKNFTGVDVTDPSRPKVIVQTDLPHNKVRSNSLETTGDVMAVAYQTYQPGLQPAGIELFDISVPENPRSISFFDCSGPHSRGVHQVWFVDGEFIHCAAGAADFTPRNPLDDQAYRIVDVRNPSKPVEAGRWWMPGTAEGDDAPPPERLKIDSGFRCHNTNVYPARPDRAYVGYIDGGFYVMDISDKSRPTVISRFNPNPPSPASPTRCCRCSAATSRWRRMNASMTTASIGRSSPGSSTYAARTIRCRSRPCPCPPLRNIAARAGASAATTCMRTRRATPRCNPRR